MITDEINDSPELFSEWFTRSRNTTPEVAEAVLREFKKGNPVVLGRNGYAPDDLAKYVEVPNDVGIASKAFAIPGFESMSFSGYMSPSEIVRDYDAYMYALKPKQHRLLVEIGRAHV